MGLPSAERTGMRSQAAEPGGIKSSADEQTASAERIGKRSQTAEPAGINLIRGRRDGTSWHPPTPRLQRPRNAATAKHGVPPKAERHRRARRDKFLHSVPEVNEAVGWRRFSFLPGEISTARDRESGSAARRNALGDGREVSSVSTVALAKVGGHITMIVNRGDERCPINYDTRKREHGKDQTDTMGRPGLPPVRQPRSGVILRAEIGAGQRKRARAKASLFRKERRRTFVTSR
jgi:hypothetical protein